MNSTMSQQLYRADNGTALRFFSRAIKNNFRSEREGRPIFDTGLFVEIMTPGQNESVPEMLVERKYAPPPKGEKAMEPERTAYYERFRKQVEAYLGQSGEHALGGTPLGQWPMIDAGTSATLGGLNVRTVEQLAEVDDNVLQNFGIGGRSLRDQAKAYLAAQDLGVPIMQEGAENAKLRDEVEALKKERDDLLLTVSKLEEDAQPPAKSSASTSVSAPDPLAPAPATLDPLAPAAKPPAKKASKDTV